MIPKLKSSFRGFYPMQSGLMHSFIRKQSPRESPFSLHIPLSLWGSSREGKCRPCWHLRLPDKQAVHRMKCRQTFSKHQSVKMSDTHPQACCVNDTAWQTASLQSPRVEEVLRQRLGIRGIRSWSQQFQCSPRRRDRQTEMSVVCASVCCKF